MKKLCSSISIVTLILAQVPTLIIILALIMQNISLIGYRFFAPAFTLFFILLTKANWLIIPIALITSIFTIRASTHPRLQFLATFFLIIPFLLTIVLSFF